MDDTANFFDHVERFNAVMYADSGVEEVAARAGGRARACSDDADAASDSWAAASEPPAYLESGGKHCEKSRNNQSEAHEEEQYEIVACGCRSRFCPQCCVGLGLTLRERLIPVLETFKRCQMWTFTVDPTLFSTPAKAFDYVRDERCIANVMRELHRRGFLCTRRYFVVVEWQMGKGDEPGTEMAHFHVLADAEFIPFNDVCELWNRFRPVEAGQVQGNRPGFGSVRFSAPEFKSAKHAAHYACKYVIKHPEKGYPAWVLDSHDIHRFSTSRGFWPKAIDDEPAADDAGESRAVDDDEPAKPDETSAERTTIRERLTKCGEKTALLRAVVSVDPSTGEETQRREFVARFDASLGEVADMIGATAPAGVKKIQGVQRQQVKKLISIFVKRAEVHHGTTIAAGRSGGTYRDFGGVGS